MCLIHLLLLLPPKKQVHHLSSYHKSVNIGLHKYGTNVLDFLGQSLSHMPFPSPQEDVNVQLNMTKCYKFLRLLE